MKSALLTRSLPSLIAGFNPAQVRSAATSNTKISEHILKKKHLNVLACAEERQREKTPENYTHHYTFVVILFDINLTSGVMPPYFL